MSIRNKKRTQRKIRIRKKVVGTVQRPRVSVFRSNTNIYAQLIDDENGKTLASASSIAKGDKVSGSSIKQAEEIGKKLSEKAKDQKIESVVFDRSGYKYHGAVAALAQTLRDNGIKL
jgi:large subunit ribosomal protein L18